MSIIIMVKAEKLRIIIIVKEHNMSIIITVQAEYGHNLYSKGTGYEHAYVIVLT